MSARVLCIIWGIMFQLACSSTDFSGKPTGKKASSDTMGAPADSDAVPVEQSLNSSEIIGASVEPPIPAPEFVELASGQNMDLFVIGDDTTIRSEVDIIFIVDTSGSMNAERDFVKANLVDFAKKFQAEASLNQNIFLMMESDSRFGIPRVDPSEPEIPESVIRLDWITNSFNALENADAFLLAMEERELQEIGGLEPIAEGDYVYDPSRPKEFVIITDDDSSYGADDTGSFIELLDMYQSTNIKFNGFVGLENSQENENCTVAAVGETYIELAKNSTYGGLIQDICEKDWSKLFKKLAASIISKHSKSDYPLSKKPLAAESISVTINDKEVAPSTWFYSADTNSVVFKEGHTPMAGTPVTVRYSIEPEESIDSMED